MAMRRTKWLSVGGQERRLLGNGLQQSRRAAWSWQNLTKSLKCKGEMKMGREGIQSEQTLSSGMGGREARKDNKRWKGAWEGHFAGCLLWGLSAALQSLK